MGICTPTDEPKHKEENDMFSKLKSRFQNTPSQYYAMSIAATWANAGSLLNGITMSQKSGVIPFLLWAIGNTLACIVFGVLAPKIPKLREVFRSKSMKIIMGIMCPFQCWISMNGIQQVFADTILGKKAGVIVALAFAVFFIVILFKFGMIRNVLTDHMSWSAVYAIVFALTIVALATSNGEYVHLVSGMDGIGLGIKNCLLLIPGAFLYPYYFELLDYNDSNKDGTNKIDIRKPFINGGLIFGFYLVFIFLMSLAVFSPALNIVKAVLVTLIAVSSLSSFLYSIYITFGKKLGLAINALTAVLWQFLIPLGVMGAWTLMASIRIYVVLGAITVALIWNYVSKRKAAKT